MELKSWLRLTLENANQFFACICKELSCHRDVLYRGYVVYECRTDLGNNCQWKHFKLHAVQTEKAVLGRARRFIQLRYRIAHRRSHSFIYSNPNVNSVLSKIHDGYLATQLIDIRSDVRNF